MRFVSYACSSLETYGRLNVSKVGAKVYIDDEGIIFDASLNQTNIGGNNNKVGASY